MADKRRKVKDGRVFYTRGSNKLYTQLDDLDELLELLKVDCPADVARAKGVPYNSLRHIIVTYYTEEEQEMINWKRRRHSNRK